MEEVKNKKQKSCSGKKQTSLPHKSPPKNNPASTAKTKQ